MQVANAKETVQRILAFTHAYPKVQGRILTYSFVPSGWVQKVLCVAACEVYYTGPALGLDRKFHKNTKLIRCSGSHAKIFLFKSQERYLGIVGSLNFVPTGAFEACVMIKSAEEMKYLWKKLPTYVEKQGKVTQSELEKLLFKAVG